jgi:hypothetical protein
MSDQSRKCVQLMGGPSTTHAAWDIHGVDGMHATFSVIQLGTARGQTDPADRLGFSEAGLRQPGSSRFARQSPQRDQLAIETQRARSQPPRGSR